MEAESNNSELSKSHKQFCENYLDYDWNATKAYQKIYPESGYDAARSSSCDLLTKPNIQAYIEKLQSDVEKMAGVSRLKVLREHMKLAFNSIANLHETWIERKELDKLSDDQKACIAEISTQTRTELKFDGESDKKEPIQVDYIKIKLYDKQKALDSITRLLGYDSATKIDHTSLGEKISSLSTLSTAELIERAKAVKDISEKE